MEALIHIEFIHVCVDSSQIVVEQYRSTTRTYTCRYHIVGNLARFSIWRLGKFSKAYTGWYAHSLDPLLLSVFVDHVSVELDNNI